MADGPTREEVALAQALEKINENLLKITEKLNSTIGDTVSKSREVAKWTEKTAEQLDRIKAARDHEAAVMSAYAANTASYQERADALLQSIQARKEYHDAVLADVQNEVEEAKKAGTLYEGQLQRLKNAKKAHEEVMEVMKAQELHAEGASEFTDNIIGKIKGAAGIGDKLGVAGQFAAAVAQGKHLNQLLPSILGGLNTMKMRALALDSMQEKLTEGILYLAASGWRQAKALDASQAAVSRLTGGMRTYDDAIQSAYESQTIFGVSTEQAAEAASTMFTNVSTFTMMSKSTQAELIKTSALLDQAGVSSATFASGIELSTKALGRTADEARRTQESLLLFARDLGVSPQMMSEEFAKAGPVISKFSYNAERGFREVAKQAKATGIEISRILDFTQQFDTFEGAADKVGSLNAMLGGDFVNAMDLMAAENPADRMRMITDAIHDAGKSFEEMSYYEKMALAEAGGFADTEELAKAMSGELDALNVSTAEQAAEQATLEKIAATNQDTMQMLQSTIAAAAPAMNMFLDALRKILEGLQKYRPVMGFVIFALGALKVAMFAAQVKTAMATLGIKSFGVATAASTVKLKIQEAAIWAQLYAEQAYLTVKNSSTLATIRGTIAEKARTAANAIGTVGSYAAAGGRMALSAASGVATIATNALSFATRILGIAMMSTPIGWIIGGIMLLIGAVYLLVKNFETVKNVVSSVFGGIVKGIAFVINAWISMINVMIKAANLVPFVNIPLIPKVGQSAPEMPPALAMGAHSFGGGPALVGEEGPEMVTLPPRASVAPAKTTSPAVATAKQLAGQAQGQKAGEANQPVNVNITLELDKRVLARHTEEVMISKLNPANA